MSALTERVGRWAPRMSASVADQGAGAITHLALHVALARLLEPSQYGMFALAFALLLFLMGAHSALVAEPMSVLGPGRYGSSLPGYVRATVRLQRRLALGAAVAAAGMALLVAPWSAALGVTLASLVVATPTFLTFVLLRRACYVLSRPAEALAGSVVYGLTMLAALVAVHRLGGLSPLTAMLLLALGAGAASGSILARLRLPRSGDVPPVDRLRQENWHYGRWILAANLAHWGGTGAYLFFVGAIAGLAEAGTFRALQTLVSPGQQVVAGLGLLALPWLAGRRGERGGAGIRLRELSQLWGPAVALVAGYGLALWAWGEPVTSFIYDRAEYTRAASLLPIFALFMVSTAIAHGLTLALRSDERSEPVFWSKLAASAVALVPGLAMTWQWGLTGAAWGMTLSVGAEGLVLAVAFARRGAP